MPQATQILDSFHVVAALHKGDRPCEGCGEARAGRETQGSSRLKRKTCYLKSRGKPKIFDRNLKK